MKTQASGIADSELLALIGRNDPFIVECGCHDGRDTKRFLDLFPQCKVLCFEPDPRPIERHDPPGFYDRIGELNPRVSLVMAAVGAEQTVATLYRSTGQPPNHTVKDWDHSNSLRPPTGHLEWSKWCEFPESKQLPVVTVTLDSQWMSTVPRIDLLWADIQGGQVAMLAGAKLTLPSVRYLYIECHKSPMYDGEPTQQEMIEMMAASGFEPLGLYEGYNFLFRNTKAE